MTDIKLITLPYINELVQLYPHFRDLPCPILLDSNQPHFADSHCDILAADPVCKITATRTATQSVGGDKKTPEWQLNWKEQPLYDIEETGNVFDYLQQLISTVCQEKWAQSTDEEWSSLPFIGGLLGYFGYESGQFLESLPNQAQQDIQLPDLHVGLYGWAIISLHKTKQTVLVITPWCDEASAIDIQSRCQNAVKKTSNLHHIVDHSSNKKQRFFSLENAFQSNMTAAQYAEKFHQVQEYIEAGDCYQVNLAQRFSSHYSGDTFDAYQTLRKNCPTPFSAYLEIDKVSSKLDASTLLDEARPRGSVLSHSPERFLHVDFLEQDKGVVETKPIKGTRARGSTKQEDQQLAEALLSSSKDKAENLMIVDLLRNDLGKTCDIGSIKVPRLFALESYANVHHLVSTVTGTIQTKEQHFEVFRNSFPGGSITGAPKIRSMEIIDELEPHERSVYCGSIAYFSVNGQMDSSITIRSLVADMGKIHCWAGGGLVADSNCQDEYEETFTKVKNLTRTLEDAFLMSS